MTLKRKTAKQAATAAKALPGKRRTAGRGARAKTRAVGASFVEQRLHGAGAHFAA